MNTDTLPRKKVERRLRKDKIDWRVSMQFSRLGPLLIDWANETFPTTIVIDAEGTIQARNLPWEETPALIERLVSAAEKN